MDSMWNQEHWDAFTLQPGFYIHPNNQPPQPEPQWQSYGMPLPAGKQNEARKYTVKDWNAQRPEIARLYEDNTLESVREFMRKQHGLDATLKQYKDRIKKWNLDKKIKTEEMEAIIRKQQERALEHKPSAFRVRKRPVSQQKINRYIKEHPRSPLGANEDMNMDGNMDGNMDSGVTPGALSCYTPSDTGPLTPHAAPSPRAGSNLHATANPQCSFLYQTSQGGLYQIGDPILTLPSSPSVAQMTSSFQRQSSSISVAASPISSSSAVTGQRLASFMIPSIPRPHDYDVLQDGALEVTFDGGDHLARPKKSNQFDQYTLQSATFTFGTLSPRFPVNEALLGSPAREDPMLDIASGITADNIPMVLPEVCAASSIPFTISGGMTIYQNIAADDMRQQAPDLSEQVRVPNNYDKLAGVSGRALFPESRRRSNKEETHRQALIWESGKEKAEEGIRRAGSLTLSNIQLPFLIHGLETEGDRVFLHYYISRLSKIFTLEGEHDSAFRNILLPIAQQHSGLMHSILALSSKHLDYTSPYGRQVLIEHPSLDVETLEKRSQFHQAEAMKELLGQQTDSAITPVELKAPSPAIYAQMICLVLQTLSDPSPNGQHRVHLEHYQRLIRENPPEQGESMKFIHEFFQYYIYVDQLIFFPKDGAQIQYVSPADEWNLPSSVLQPSTVRLLGVFDGLFLYMSKITNIRNKIRYNLERNINPVLDNSNLYTAAEIDAGIREWTPAWPPGDPRDNAGLLYRQMMWIYLWRSVFPPQTTNWKVDPKITCAVNDGIALLARFAPRDPSQTLILAPAFVIGCAAFEVEQREPIRKAIKTVKAYMEYKNTDTALEVLEEVWRLMDAKDERSWDWQAITSRMEIDFLAT